MRTRIYDDMMTTFLTDLARAIPTTRSARKDDMISQNRCLQARFINDVYEKKRDLTDRATEFRAMAHAVIKMWMAGFGLWALGIWTILPPFITWVITHKHSLDNIPLDSMII